MAYRELIDRARSEGRNFLLEPEAYELCEAFGIPHPAYELAADEESAVQAAAKIGYPVVLKIVSPDILHKSDVGGVVVGLGSEADLREGYAKLIRNVKERAADARITGVLVQAMRKGSAEVVVGGLRDALFGPVVMFGSGGIMIEVFKDVSFRLAPLDAGEAMRQMQETKAYTMLQGVRGEAASDTEAVAQLLVNAGRLLVEVEDVQELDFNPVMASPDGCIVVDARIILSE